MIRYVRYVKLHGSDAFLPGVGCMGSTLPPVNKTLKLKMWVDSSFPTILFVTVNGIDSSIPLANVQILEFEPETKANVTSISVEKPAQNAS